MFDVVAFMGGKLRAEDIRVEARPVGAGAKALTAAKEVTKRERTFMMTMQLLLLEKVWEEESVALLPESTSTSTSR